MHLITQSCVLFLWMHSLTFVKGQDCTLEQFLNSPLYNKNFDTSGLAATYSGGKQVRVGCNVGFSGFFKLICVEGQWDSKGKICTLKPCGHPGDSQNADFQLEKGEDFVFGSQVKYTCHKGYQMVSRTNYRRCMAQGWDGNIPVCEAQQCPIINVDEQVHVNGNIEEATFGNVVQFSCKSSSKMLFGSAEMYCDENGEWVGKSPTCKEIICTAPEIENGEVLEQIQEYKEHQILEFRCDRSFTRADARSPKCTKQGARVEWSPTPLCKPITCQLQLLGLKGTSYVPANKDTFLPGDQVTVNCGDTHWIVSHHQRVSVVTTCKEDGLWTIRPECQEVTCSKRVPHVSWDSQRPHTLKLGYMARYRCERGYTRKDDSNDMATCTRDGWHPNPLCEGAEVLHMCIVCPIFSYILGLFSVMTCPQPVYPNASIEEYKYQNKVKFICNNGYEGEFTVTCGDYGWSRDLPCREKQCKKPHIDDANFIGVVRESYRQNDHIKYSCKNNVNIIVTLTCEENGWNGTQSCSACLNVKVPNGFGVPYKDTLYYTCEEGYKLPTKGWWAEAKCNDSVSSELKPCIENTKCGDLPVIPNGKVTVAAPGESAQVNCKGGYSTEVSHFSCRDGKWNSNGVALKIICTPIAKPCSPPLKVQNAVLVTPYQKKYLSDSTVTYKCRESYTAVGETTIRCMTGQWGETDIMCTHFVSARLLLKMQLSLILLLLQLWRSVEVTLSQNACAKVPHIPHAHVVDETKRAEYQEGNVIHFACETGYISGLTIKYVCTNEGWHVLRKGSCYLKPCELPDDTPNGFYQIIHGEELVFGTQIKYFCNEGYQMVSKDDTRTCFLDNWTNHLPICDPLSCDLPPADGGFIVKGIPENDDPILPDRFLEFSCDGPWKYLNGSSMLICLKDGQWDNAFPTCEKKCKVTGVSDNVRLDTDPEKLRFSCHENGDTLLGNAEVTCLANGQWSAPFPTCGAPSDCGKPTPLEDGDIEGTVGHRYRHGDWVKYTCPNYYKMQGDPHKTCTNGEWIGQMRCLKPCTVNSQDMTTHHIDFRHVQQNKMYSTPDDTIEFRCTSGTHDGAVDMRQKCNDGVILLPTFFKEQFPRKQTYIFLFAPKVTGVSDNVRLDTDPEKLRFSCHENGDTLLGNAEVTCLANGQWSAPFPTCGAPLDCGKPTPLEDGDIEGTVGHRYRHGDRVKYICPNYYKMQGDPHKTCTNGEWIGQMRCLKPCIVNSQDMTTHHIDFRHVQQNKMYLKPDDTIEFRCTSGTHVGAVDMRQKCNDGVILLPTCHLQKYSYSWILTMTYLYFLGFFILCLQMDTSLQQEAQQCPIINVDEQVHVNGNIEEATFGNVVRFSCKSSSQVLFGSAEMYCDENGEWVGKSPTCKEIICTAPEIENGEVLEQIQEYKEHQILEFRCDRSFTRADARSPKCTKQGARVEWSPTPLCEPITCQLQLLGLKGTSYVPANKDTFLPGDQVTVNCGDTHWIVSHHQRVSVVTTCKEDGLWTIRPECQEVTCSKRVPHVSWDSQRPHTLKLGYMARYRCERGYTRKDDSNDMATCTRDGWHPNPLCEEVLGCGTAPSIADGDLKYARKSNNSHNEMVKYMCQAYYTMEGEPYKTCVNGVWTGHMRCIQPCTVNEDDNRHNNITFKYNGGTYFTHDEIIEFKCARGIPVGSVSLLQRCNSGVIVLPTCQEF
ncbi:complement factor H-like [Pseudochaenichthys georgianus]|uniref:complement factor H-like n=1 Tax=Pseudochaenichthys georgianus TaxID=52239 RepID=UPI0039C4099C